MNTDFIRILSEAFSAAVNAAVDARITGILQQHANVVAGLSIDNDNLKQRVANLELRMPINTDLNKIREMIDTKIEEALDEHANAYDHDRYDSVCDDFENRGNGDIEDAVRDVMRNASFSVEVSL